ncbi:MAG: hypothetical protein KA314_04570 [Chloroflexi bacterium]|nr:hypothetical protein [Chloroflexota bacterium]
MLRPQQLPEYRWPSLKVAVRQYVVRDDRGRYGIGYVDHRREIIWAYPIGVQTQIKAPDNLALPDNATILTSSSWMLQADGKYRGYWYDDDVPVGRVSEEYFRYLEIVDDLGWRMPDSVADQALEGSDQMGHWNYGATLGRVGGEPPVKGQHGNEMSIDQAVDYAKEVGEKVTDRGLRLACKNGYIPGSRKVGRDWLITYEGMNYYLDNRPKPGPRTKAAVSAAKQ